MRARSSSIYDIKLRREHKRQKRIALQMLTLSGVVRPSHVEFHYATPLTRITAFRTQPAATKYPLIRPIPTRSWEHNITANMKQTWQWARSLSFAIVHLAKKPIALHWAKQLDV